MTESVTGQPVPYDVVARRPGDPTATFADPTRAKEAVGWDSQFGLREIVSAAYEWHRSQID